MHKIHIACAGAVLAAAALLTGCGGGGDDAPQARTTDVPQSAQSSVAGLIAYLGELIAGTSETSEPVLLGDATLPVDDTAQPSPLP